MSDGLPAYLLVCLPTGLSVCLSVCLSVSVCLAVSVSVCLSVSYIIHVHNYERCFIFKVLKIGFCCFLTVVRHWLSDVYRECIPNGRTK